MILVGPKGVYHARGSVIVAKAHVHMTKRDAEQFRVRDGERVCARLDGARSLTLNDVIVRVSDTSALALHMDYDEANAAMFSGSGSAVISKCGGSQSLQSMPAQQAVCAGSEEKNPTAGKKRLITEALAREMVSQGLSPADGDMLTPAAKDVFRAALSGRKGERGSV